jgi:hypothetical protein
MIVAQDKVVARRSFALHIATIQLQTLGDERQWVSIHVFQILYTVT